MSILETLGSRRKPTESRNALLPIEMLAKLGCAWAMNGEPYDACEVWYDGDDDLIHMRMYDQRSPRRWVKPPAGMDWSCAYSDDGGKPNGTAKEVTLAPEIREWRVDEVQKLINQMFTAPLELAKP